MSSSPEWPLGGQDPYALSRGEGDDVLDDELLGQLVALPPLPRPYVPRRRRIRLAIIVSALAAIAFYRLFVITQPAQVPPASASATRVVDAAPADEPAAPPAPPADEPAAPPAPPPDELAAPPAPPPPATLLTAAATPPTQKVSAFADTRSAAAEPQASEPPRAMSPEQRQAMASLVARGKELLQNGDFSSARLILEHVADAGEADAALTLGSTYDPTVLAELGIRGQAADVDLARTWYEKAQEFGSTEATSRLKTLPSR
jgi:type IV secretory pathway VirB10-like protein